MAKFGVNMAKLLQLGEKCCDHNFGNLQSKACGNLNEIVGGSFGGKKRKRTKNEEALMGKL